KWSGTLGPDGAAETVRAALELALRAPAGAVHLDFDPTAGPAAAGAGDGPGGRSPSAGGLRRPPVAGAPPAGPGGPDAASAVAGGLDPVEPIPAEWRYDAPVLAVHPWPLADPYYEPTVELNGSVGDNLAAFDGAWRSDWPPDAGRAAKAATRSALAVQSDGFT